MAKAKRHPPLDTSHSPFKRMATFGTGARGRPEVKVRGRYSCTRGNTIRGKKGEAITYVQKCTDSVTGKVRKIKIDAAWKAEYNHDYAQSRTRSAARNTYRAGFKPPAGSKLYEAGQKALSRRRG